MKIPKWMNTECGYARQEIDLKNLNHAQIDDDTAGRMTPLSSLRSSKSSKECAVQVVFQDHEEYLVELISKYDCVVGCMAWLTNEAILKELSRSRLVSILVQKEDFLRPDGGKWSKHNLIKLYGALPVSERYMLDMSYNFASGSILAPVRCVGTCPEDKTSAMSRMHHKFLVFGNIYVKHDNDDPQVEIQWDVVWTGSFNATENATRSLENAVIIHDCNIAEAFKDEFITLFGISEPLNWESRWVRPEYRIGT